MTNSNRNAKRKIRWDSIKLIEIKNQMNSKGWTNSMKLQLDRVGLKCQEAMLQNVLVSLPETVVWSRGRHVRHFSNSPCHRRFSYRRHRACAWHCPKSQFYFVPLFRFFVFVSEQQQQKGKRIFEKMLNNFFFNFN